jgi:hypothetical protein
MQRSYVRFSGPAITDKRYGLYRGAVRVARELEVVLMMLLEVVVEL